MDIAAVERLVKLTEASQVYQITIEDNDQSISVVNGSRTAKSSVRNPIDSSSIEAGDNTNSSLKAKNNNAQDQEALQVRSPHVSYMRLSADGATDNVIQKGDAIEIGQTIGFVEVLTKLLPVTSDKAGTVNEILVEESQVVEYGQPILQLTE